MSNQSIHPHRWREAFNRVSMVLLVLGWVALLWVLGTKDPYGNDFYTIYLAAQALVQGFNPYGPEVQAQFRAIWEADRIAFASVGFVYPLPAVVAFWPILILPLPLAIGVWLGFGSLGAFLAIKIRDDWRSLALLLLLFMPLHRTITVKQPSLGWLALLVVLIFAMQRRLPPWVAAFCIVALPAKPQTGLVFALAGLVWAWQKERRALSWIAVWGAIIWGGSFLIVPGWIGYWLESLRTYAVVGAPPSILPWALVVIVACARLPWYAILAAIQVVVFPLTDVYSLAPLLLVWVAIGGPLALYGSALTWMWQFAPLEQPLWNAWAFVLLPLTLCALWRSFGPLLRKRVLGTSAADSGNLL